MGFTKYVNKFSGNMKSLEMGLDEMKRYCCNIRVLCHTQVRMVPGLNGKKPHIIEIEVLGGSIHDKVTFSLNLLEKEVPVDATFKVTDSIDVISISKGKG